LDFYKRPNDRTGKFYQLADHRQSIWEAGRT
jgi:hypothetical protein